jgi:hypothetical protein
MGEMDRPNIDEEQDSGSEMRKSCDTLHLDGVHLFQRVVETVSVSTDARSGRSEGFERSIGSAAMVRDAMATYIPGVSIT